ncbi:ubiquitin carboxyl-terminal hydrolase L5 [Capsaspora owczarzaki ATCC 30864]|uniref:Ubiquitin carboxyl-terminal hydrolase n=2 Tax=Capsaspora owczarzaki (strain ATCC 30864) TaxID=595528 RepID=A0A0D2X1A0_CAPO3|nr:ubiquitin carboxyl-terminal hydrolase L5 [Capsaspora owczarzaki ATCC 30864]
MQRGDRGGSGRGDRDRRGGGGRDRDRDRDQDDKPRGGPVLKGNEWKCDSCTNINWAWRKECNQCGMKRRSIVEERTGAGGGYNERENVEYRDRQEDDEYDDFGRKKRKPLSGAAVAGAATTAGTGHAGGLNVQSNNSKDDDRSNTESTEDLFADINGEREGGDDDDDDDDDDDEDVDLSKTDRVSVQAVEAVETETTTETETATATATVITVETETETVITTETAAVGLAVIVSEIETEIDTETAVAIEIRAAIVRDARHEAEAEAAVAAAAAAAVVVAAHHLDTLALGDLFPRTLRFLIQYTMSAGNWCLIESDPGVFTELIRSIGVQGVQVEELYSLDEGSLSVLQPVHGLIFLFKWQKDLQERKTAENASSVFFANQVINNACATQAILSILLNTPELNLGEELTNFKAFTQDFTPELRGLAISNSEKIRTVHNSFARPETFSIEEKNATDDDDVFHFVAYIHKDGRLWELDGLQEGPINLGEASADDWLFRAAPIIQARIERYSSTEIRFNLMAVVADKTVQYTQELAAVDEQRAMLMSQMQSDQVSGDLAALDARSSELQMLLATEQEKNERYRTENIRRRHNFVPFIVKLLRLLAEKHQLQPLIAKAKETVAAKNKANAESRK